MSYIGTEPKDIRSFGRTKFDYTATQGQTAFTGADDDGKVLAFTTGQIEVFVNGILMDESDFTTTGTGTVTLASAANLNDVISIVSFETNIPDSNYVPATGGNFTGNVGINKTPTAKLHIHTGTSNSDFDQVLIEGNLSSASSNPEITLLRNDSSPADNDYIGGINFYGKNDADEDIKYAQIVGRAIDVSDSSEDGAFAVFCESASALRETLFVSGNDSRLRTNNLRIASHLTSGENSAGTTLALIRNDTSVASGDVLGTIGFGHFDGTPDFPSQTPQQLPASIRSVAAETQGSGDEGANMEFYTKPINANKDVSSTLNMKIGNDGSVTMPNQPSFHAKLTSNQTGFDATSLGNHFVTFDSEVVDQGNNHSNGVFTAPVAGTYFFKAEAYGSVNFSQSWLVINGSRADGTDTVYNPATNFAYYENIVHLSANDTVSFHPYISSNSNVTINVNANHTYWKGHLLG